MLFARCQFSSPRHARPRAWLSAALVALSLAACAPSAPVRPATPIGAVPTAAPLVPSPTVTPRGVPTITISPIWRPAARTSWQWQLAGLPVDQTVDADLYDIDLFETDARVVAALHAQGRKAICYMSAGTWEQWRSDAGAFPRRVLGQSLEDWPDERWLDIRQLDVLGPIIERRMDICRAKGFDGVEPDNVDAYSNETGFPLTYQDQIDFNIFLASAAHARGLAVGLKNDLEQIDDLVTHFDFAINEQCFQEGKCASLAPFTQAGKAVFQVEYQLPASQFCPRANELGFNSLRKNRELDAYREPCR